MYDELYVGIIEFPHVQPCFIQCDFGLDDSPCSLLPVLPTTFSIHNAIVGAESSMNRDKFLVH